MEESHEIVDHEMHLVLHVLEDCADKLDENQALGLFQRKLELFSIDSLFSMEELDELTLARSSNDEEGATISLVDNNYIVMDLAHHDLTHIFNSTTSFGDEDGVKGFSLLAPHEE